MIKTHSCKEIIKKISYRKNIILIEFNKNMNLIGEHSYLIPQNYAIKKERVIKVLPIGTKIEVIKVGYIIKIILPECEGYLSDKCDLNLGYLFRNKIFYIESKEGIVDFPYNIKNIGNEVEELDLKNGICEIINSNSLRYSYNARNQFSYIDINDFYVEKDNKVFYPKSFLLKKHTEIIFTFDSYIFNGKNSNVYLKTKKYSKSKDVYGFFLSQDSLIEAVERSYIESLSFSDYKDNTAFLKIKFSKPILEFYAEDFLIRYYNKIYNVEFLSYSFKNTVIDVVVNNIKIETSIRSIFTLVMPVEYENIKTIDYLENKISFQEEIISQHFSSNSIYWNLESYNLKNSLIRIGFEKEIIPSSIITNSSFDLEEKPWNGNILTIPPGKIMLSYEEDDNKQILSLSNNKEFGKIVTYFKNQVTYEKRTVFNKKTAMIYLKEKNLFIKFNKDENLYLYLDFIDLDNVKYYAGNNIRSLENYFIFSGHYPIGKINVFENSVNLKPLKNEKENPFKGEVVTSSYILNVDNENKFRTYGVSERITIIEGSLKIIGNLNINEKIYIKNLKVIGKVYIKIGEGNIELDKLECIDLLWN